MVRMLDDGENSLPADAQIQTIGQPIPRISEKPTQRETLRKAQMDTLWSKWVSIVQVEIINGKFLKKDCYVKWCRRSVLEQTRRSLLDYSRLVIPTVSFRCVGWNAWSPQLLLLCSAVPGLLAALSRVPPLSAPIPHRCCRVRRLARRSLNPRLKWQADLRRTSPLFLQNKSGRAQPHSPRRPHTPWFKSSLLPEERPAHLTRGRTGRGGAMDGPPCTNPCPPPPPPPNHHNTYSPKKKKGGKI